ncbi:MAG: DUF1987 domain-containing protein [Bacteroidales bacterium]|nr:DUF1987 domain-containing protein [Bacteroidales bacterium]MDD7725228.1 DUF1987 domain-containing protein [Bacteroidales bacterium]MDY4175541.1 DUF1987 domain-containing protein [Bacteroidales bacterium]
METITLQESAKTPYILMDPDKGIIEIKGRSIPENSVEFYRSVNNWLNEYAQGDMKSTKVRFQLEYFNTSSSKCILDIFKKLEVMYRKGWDVNISWCYDEDDEDMYESGEDYQSILSCPISLEKISGGL